MKEYTTEELETIAHGPFKNEAERCEFAMDASDILPYANGTQLIELAVFKDSGLPEWPDLKPKP